MPWFVYILECAGKSYYTGITTDVFRRMTEHESGQGGKYTRNFGPVKLLWTEEHSDRTSAHKRELQIQGWTRRKKEALIQGDLKLLKVL
jgi:putative endonuclease